MPAGLISLVPSIIARWPSLFRNDGCYQAITFRREGHPVSVLHFIPGPSSPDAGAALNEGGEDPDISGLLDMLESVTDPRSPRGKRHALTFVLAICVVATLAGAKGYREIALDGKVMRGAWTDENDKVTLFSAMLHREAVTIAQSPGP